MFHPDLPSSPSGKRPRGDTFRIFMGGMASAFGAMTLFYLGERLAQPLEPYFSDGQAGFGLAIGSVLGWLLGASVTAIGVLGGSATPVGAGRVLGAVMVVLLGMVVVFPATLFLQIPLLALDMALNWLVDLAGVSTG